MSKKSLINVYKLLNLLKMNTDKDHPTSQAKLRKLVGEEKAGVIFGDKGTFTRRLRELADAFNTDENGEVLGEADWKIVYPGYNKSGKNGQIYYNQSLSNFELEFLLGQIEGSAEFTKEEKESFKKRLTEANSSKFFDRNSIESQAIVTDTTKECADESISKKIAVIRNNIIRKKMLEFDVEDNNKVETIRVTPYRIVKKNNGYWLIGNRHAIPREDVPWNSYNEDLFSYRLDLLENISTAHTEEETIIHWTMTKDMRPGKPFSRSGAGRETKARYNESIDSKLEALENCNYNLEFVHNAIIKTNQ